MNGKPTNMEDMLGGLKQSYESSSIVSATV